MYCKLPLETKGLCRPNTFAPSVPLKMIEFLPKMLRYPTRRKSIFTCQESVTCYLGKIASDNAQRVLELWHIQIKLTACERAIPGRNLSLFHIFAPLVSCLHKGIYLLIERFIGSEPTTFLHSASAAFYGPKLKINVK
jgi:hypothetical protein